MDITKEEFFKKRSENKGVIIDVRTKEEHDEGHLAETDSNYDYLNGDFLDKVESLDKNETYYLYCRSGRRSGKAARMLRDHGFDHAYNIGRFEDLVEAGGGRKED